MRKSKYNSIFQGKWVLGKRRVCLLCGKQQQSCFLASVEVWNENEPLKGVLMEHPVFCSISTDSFFLLHIHRALKRCTV